MEKFKALRVRSEGKNVSNQIEELSLDDLAPGNWVVPPPRSRDTVTLEDLPRVFDDLLKARIRGRTVVKIG